MQKKYTQFGRLLTSGLIFMAMFSYVIWLTSATVEAKTAVSPITHHPNTTPAGCCNCRPTNGRFPYARL